jgi:hypothetical protein
MQIAGGRTSVEAKFIRSSLLGATIGREVAALLRP